MILSLLVLVPALLLAYSNGANDNFKGVATLFGSATCDYRRALVWATLTTGAGSLTALMLSHGLIQAFSGKGLVPDEVLAFRPFPLAVALSAALTVLAATRVGFPISTTHALVGSLVGAGWMASAQGINFGKLGGAFFLPLLSSPLLAAVSAVALYPLFRSARLALGVTKESCVCLVGEPSLSPVSCEIASAALAAPPLQQPIPCVVVGTPATCTERYEGTVAGVSAQSALDALHYVSAGAVGFARGLNDTPKIAAVMIAGAALPPQYSVASIAAVMALGGWLNARRVAETMAHKVTAMNHGQGFTANLITATVVLLASAFGIPVSTTHVSCGALFGIGGVTKQARWKTITAILAAWITTLPLGALLGAFCFLAVKALVA